MREWLMTSSVGPPQAPTTRAERQFQLALHLLAAYFAVQAVLYFVEVFAGTPDSRPYAVNSFSKDVLFGALSLVAAADVRHRGGLVTFVLVGHLAIVGALAAVCLAGDTSATFPPPRWLADALGMDLAEGLRLPAWLAAAGAVTAWMAWLQRRARRTA
ncbi:MAG: hypothetical protein ACR2L8_02080 [Solirubrobacteraceae bacterium]